MKAFWRSFKRNKAAVAGLFVAFLMLLIAVAAPLLAPRDPLSMSGDTLMAPTGGFWMGTDDVGRDVLSRFLYGARITLSVGILSAMTSCIIGVVVGAVAGYSGGIVDIVLMRVSELFHVIPRFFLALLAIALFGTNFVLLILVIGGLSWTEVARLMRAEFLTLREREYVMAAKSVGVPRRTIIFGEILPNAIPPLIVIATLQISMAILLEASLSFLGLGDSRQASWGLMLFEAQRFLGAAWWMAVFPGLGIFVTVAAFNMIGDGLTDTFNPRLRGR